MPNKIKKILIIGAGPTLIGSGGEFDFAAIQAGRVLKDFGYEIIAVDSNPAAVLGDPGLADRVYSEPLTVESLTKLIRLEKPDAILPIFGGQNGLNLIYFLNEKGLFTESGIEIIGVNLKIIQSTENLQCFYENLAKLEIDLPKHGFVRSVHEGKELAVSIGFPLVVKGAMAPEGAGVITAYNRDELKEGLELALELSPINQALLAEGLQGWKEVELELIRDSSGCCRLVALVENIDPVGVHSGDSMTVVPAQGIAAGEAQRIIGLGKAVMDMLEIVGGANVQIAINPNDGRVAILEVNPRFTRSAALASLATGLPVAALAVRVALGEKLAQLWPDVEMVPDNVLVKIPRFNFEKFPTANPVLTSRMKSTGAAVGIGSNFKEAYQKALRSLGPGFGIIQQSNLSPWFLKELVELNAFEKKLNTYALYNLPQETLLQAKQWGYSDEQLARYFRTNSAEIKKQRLSLKVTSNYKQSRDCRSAGGYLYSTYQGTGTAPDSETKKIILIGGGPNRIGQGSDFDHSLYHAAAFLKKMDYTPVLVNCNPYTAVLDSILASKNYLEPVTKEDLLNIIDREEPVGVICQMGGSIVTDLSRELLLAGVKVLGTNPRLKEVIEDRDQFDQILAKLGLEVLKNGKATDPTQAREIANQIGYPLIIHDVSAPAEFSAAILQQTDDLEDYFKKVKKSKRKHVFQIAKLIEGGIGVEIDCVADGENAVICGIMEQIEETGIHPGDSAASLPPYTLAKGILFRIRKVTIQLAKELGVRGMIHLYYAIKQNQIYLISLNLGAGRTVPFISKVTDVDWAGAAAGVIMGLSLAEQNLLTEVTPKYIGIKEVVLPFDRFPGVDALLGPEMRSTGTVMGLSSSFGLAFIKSQLASGGVIPLTGMIFVSIRNEERRIFIPIAKQLVDLGYQLMATAENSEYLVKNGVSCHSVFQIGEGRPNILDQIKNGKVQWVISTSSDRNDNGDEGLIRSVAVAKGIPIITTLAAAQAAVSGLESYLKEGLKVESPY